jgi:serine/threonine-protein kinase
MKLEVGQVIADRYTIDTTLGSGGMSVVYRAHDKKLDRFVTLKCLREEYLSDENLIARFPEEARAAAALNHQNIAGVFDHGRDGDVQYIALEYVDGKSLKELIKARAPFDDESTLGVAIQVADGLAEAHKNNIIHLDIKPQNILVTSTLVKVTDFGIARAARGTTVNAGAGSMGSVHYFSPEQARGGYIDHKSDIYSLGIVMYEMATGQVPFDGDTEVSVALQQINQPLPSMLPMNPGISESLVRIIKKATEKSASKRYASIEDMSADLKRALTDASGEFVYEEADETEQPTRNVEKNREALKAARKTAREAYLNGNQEYVEGQEYAEGVYDFGGQEFDPDAFEPPPRDKKADRIAVYIGIVLGTIAIAIIVFFAVQLHRWLSSDMEWVPVPDIVGMSRQQAEEIADELGLILRVGEEAYSEEYPLVPAGYILAQGRIAGHDMNVGDVLYVTLSLGQRAAANMPHLVGMHHDDAIAILDGLAVTFTRDIILIFDDTLAPNIILEQTPSAGEPIGYGAVITLRISAEEADEDGYVAMPNVRGRVQAEATQLLGAVGLIPVITLEASNTFDEGVVITQYPEPENRIQTGSTIYLTVSSGPPDEPDEPDTPEDPDEPDTPETPETPDDPTPPPPPDPAENGEENGEDNGENNGDEPAQPDPPATVTRSFTVVAMPHLWQEDAEYINMLIRRRVGHYESDFFAEAVAVDSFPRTFTVEIASDELFSIFINGVLAANQPLNFAD